MDTYKEKTQVKGPSAKKGPVSSGATKKNVAPAACPSGGGAPSSSRTSGRPSARPSTIPSRERETPPRPTSSTRSEATDEEIYQQIILHGGYPDSRKDETIRVKMALAALNVVCPKDGAVRDASGTNQFKIKVKCACGAIKIDYCRRVDDYVARDDC